jgi:hypothetical protein
MTRAAHALDLQALVDDLDSLAADLDHLEMTRRYRADAWTWIAECVWTVDELDPANPIKPFPVAVCAACGVYVGHAQRAACPRCGQRPAPLAYLEILTREWQYGTHTVLLVPKAHRMKLSWLFCALAAWLAFRQPHAVILLISQKEEKSAALLDRVAGIFARLPAAGGGGLRLRRTEAPPKLLLIDNGSLILGVAEGSDQVRSYTANYILADEAAHWQNLRAAYGAMVPATEGGGRLVLLSSPAPGTFRELITGEAF